MATYSAVWIGSILAFLLGMGVTALLAWLLLHRWLRINTEKQNELLATAKREAEAAARRIKTEAEKQIEQRRAELEETGKQRQKELKAREREVEQAELKWREQSEALDNRMRALDERSTRVEERASTLDELVRDYRQRLQKASGLDEKQARESLMEEIRRDCEDEMRAFKAELLQRSESEVQEEARRVLVDSMQRLSSTPHHDITATIVPLPSDDMKGRIIGREGRNIKSFESATGVTLLIDETPDSVLISSFDPVRREIARVALENLIRDGRIHPASIEDAVSDATEQIKRSVTEFGEDALRRLRLNHVHPEVVQLLGKLRYRLSNNQNSLDHSVEVANLCALMAAELELDTDIAKRCGLLHDIGKSLDAEYEGSHATAGANILKRCNEDDRVVNAVAAHHEEVEPTSAFAALVMIADTVSAIRPGARAESIDSYIQRVRKLESLARTMQGVVDAYAIQAGREIRVVVAPDRSNEEDTRMMARKLRRKIENELQYPGTIKITVIREQRFVETAK